MSGIEDVQGNRLLEIMESIKKTSDSIFRYASLAIMLMLIVVAIIFFGLVIIESPGQRTFGTFILTWCMFAIVGVSFIGINAVAIEMVVDGLQLDNRISDEVFDFVLYRTLGLTVVSIICVIIIPLFQGNAALENAIPGISDLLVVALFLVRGSAIGGLTATAHLGFRKRSIKSI